MSDIDLPSRLLGPSTPSDAPKGPTRTAIAAAIVLHVVLIAWFLYDPRFAPSIPPPQAPIPVTLVTIAPPPAPTPAPAPAPPKPAPPPQFATRESGPDERTTAPARAAEPAPEPVAPPTPAEPAPTLDAPAPTKPVGAAEELQAPPATVAPTPEVKPQPKPHPTVAHAEPRKEALASAAPPMHSLLNRELGEREESGDPYLNLMWHRIEDNRQPTTPIGSSGLHLEGIATFELTLDRGGRLRGISLLRSSGATQLDEEVRRMIISATPFPPLPMIYPDPVAIKVTIRLSPR